MNKVTIIKNNFDEELEKVEARFKDISNTIKCLSAFKEIFLYEVYSLVRERTCYYISVLNIIDEIVLFKEHKEEALKLLEKKICRV